MPRHHKNCCAARLLLGVVAIATTTTFFLPSQAEAFAPRTNFIDAFAGISGTSGHAGDGGAATSATLASPTAAAVAPDGDVYILERASIRRVDASTRTISTIAPSGIWRCTPSTRFRDICRALRA